MQIRFISVIVLLSLVFSANAQKKTDWEKLNLKGKVSSTNTTSYRMDDDYSGVDNNVREQYAFNNKGFKTKEVLREGFEAKVNTTYKYNANNDVTEENSKLVKSNSSHKYKYDKKSNTAVVSFHVANGVLIAKFKQKYDENGNIIEKLVENQKEKGKTQLVESYWYQYDDKGNLIEEKQRIDTINKRIEYKYDEGGYLIEQTEFDSNGIPTYWHTYKYDDQGNVLEDVSAFRGYDKTVMNYVYVYDSNSNWIERREQLGTSTRTLSRREIQYY